MSIQVWGDGWPGPLPRVAGPRPPGSAESGTVYTNEGAAEGATLTLPAAAPGQYVTCIIQAARALVVTAGAGDTIRLGGAVTAAGGSVTSAVVGATLVLLAINTSEWVATAVVGSWSL